ncbi:hypothetical protein MRX96_002508 [Rhipicephalus microplus]
MWSGGRGGCAAVVLALAPPPGTAGPSGEQAGQKSVPPKQHHNHCLGLEMKSETTNSVKTGAHMGVHIRQHGANKAGTLCPQACVARVTLQPQHIGDRPPAVAAYDVNDRRNHDATGRFFMLPLFGEEFTQCVVFFDSRSRSSGGPPKTQGLGKRVAQRTLVIRRRRRPLSPEGGRKREATLTDVDEANRASCCASCVKRRAFGDSVVRAALVPRTVISSRRCIVGAPKMTAPVPCYHVMLWRLSILPIMSLSICALRRRSIDRRRQQRKR